MTHNQFIRMPAQSTTLAKYEAIINRHFINYAVPSNDRQVGETIVTLAPGRNGSNTVASMYDLATLARKISHLTPVRVYSTSRGEVSGPALVNMERVVQITEYEKFINLTFIDGDDINVVDRLV